MPGYYHTVPYGTDPQWALSPGTACLATLIQSLRDKDIHPLAAYVKLMRMRAAAG